STADPITANWGAEHLVGPNRRPALLAVDDGDRGERRAARRATPHELSATLRAGVGHLRLVLLEPPARRAATQTERNPIAEDFPTLSPQPIRRLRHVLTIAVAVLLVAACGGPAYSSTRGGRIIQFTLHSRLTHGVRHEVLVVPKRHGDWMLVLLHGYHASPSM